MTFFKKNSSPYYKGLKITTNTTTISIIVGISLIILKNLDVFIMKSFKQNHLRYFPSKK